MSDCSHTNCGPGLCFADGEDEAEAQCAMGPDCGPVAFELVENGRVVDQFCAEHFEHDADWANKPGHEERAVAA